jgi:hypothetical protein
VGKMPALPAAIPLILNSYYGVRGLNDYKNYDTILF